jgi:hypothetical protein
VAEAERQALKSMTDNVVAYFYPWDLDSDSAARAPMLLDMMPTQSREIIISNMRKASNLTLGIFKSLYPQADLDAAGEAFAATCIKEEAEKLVEDSVDTAARVIKMIPVDMS